jgi:hypothetical protein
MKCIPISASSLVGVAICLLAQSVLGQVVINEVVKEQRTAGSGAFDPDTREFVELYNSGVTAVDISGWTLGTYDLVTGTPEFTDTMPGGSMIGPGDFFVVGAAGVPNVDFVPFTGEIYTDNTPRVLELRDLSSAMVDAVAYEVFRTGATGLSMATADQLAQIGSGFQGQLISMNANAPNVPESWSRYRDGVDTNSNGRDFGILPLTPGASNNLPLNASHTVPDVDGLAVGTALTDYHASFVLPRVIDPTVATPGLNPRAIPASPQGGKAIVAWDNTGGGNTVYSKELVNSFDLYAYFDTTPLGVSAETNDEEWESVMYGIGSSDAFFGTPDPTGDIFTPGTITQNGSTGIGWLFQQYEGGPLGGPDITKLILVDFGDGGNSLPDAGEWTVIDEIDMSAVSSGWYRLGLDYDPTTGDVVATFDDQTFMFTTATNLLGTFFVGYREGITDEQSRFDKLNPPIYDLYQPAAGLTGDFNHDNKVDAADYILWRKNPSAFGDAQGYADWKAHFGETTLAAGGTLNGIGAVPEPSAVGLAMLGLLAACAKRRWAQLSQS